MLKLFHSPGSQIAFPFFSSSSFFFLSFISVKNYLQIFHFKGMALNSYKRQDGIFTSQKAQRKNVSFNKKDLYFLYPDL